MLLGDGQCGGVDALVDHLALACLEREQPLARVAHPRTENREGSHSYRLRHRETLTKVVRNGEYSDKCLTVNILYVEQTSRGWLCCRTLEA